jgi:pSer/pThr/pTyr-binding forkhead associated (FHA) protein
MPRVIITVPEKTSQPYRFSLDRKVVTMGRGSENDIVIESGSVSVQHAEMKRVEGGFEIEDLGSTNGVKSEGKRQMKFALSSGMNVLLGDVSFEFTLSEEEIEALVKERLPVEIPASQELVAEQALEQEEVVEAKPKRKRPEPKVAATVSSPSALGTILMLVLFLILAGAAFISGAAIRHERDTGESLLKGIVNKEDMKKPKSSEEKTEE